MISNHNMLSLFLKYKIFLKLNDYLFPTGYNIIFDTLSICLYYPVFVFIFLVVKSKTFSFLGDEFKRFYYSGDEFE